MKIIEEWKPVVGFEGLYEISNLGRVKSCSKVIVCRNGKTRRYKEKILNPGHGQYGRNQYTLSKNGYKYNVRGYRLVAEAFLPNPNNLSEVNHIDGNNLNDRIDNLEWISVEDNIQHAIENDLLNTYYNRF